MQIDLGRKMDTPSPSSVAGPSEDNSDSMHYPCFYVDDADEALKDLPDEGTMTIQFRKRRATQTTTDDGTSHSAEIEVQKILDVEAGGEDEGAEDRDEESEDALDSLAADEESRAKAAKQEDEE